MLGPSIIFAGTPLALIVSALAVGRASDRPFAVAGLILSGLEALLLGTLIVMAF